MHAEQFLLYAVTPAGRHGAGDPVAVYIAAPSAQNWPSCLICRAEGESGRPRSSSRVWRLWLPSFRAPLCAESCRVCEPLALSHAHAEVHRGRLSRERCFLEKLYTALSPVISTLRCAAPYSWLLLLLRISCYVPTLLSPFPLSLPAAKT